MNKFIKFPAIALIALSLASCGDDDPENGGNGGNGGGGTPLEPQPTVAVTPKPAEIFPNGLPASISGLNLAQNDKGLLTSMTGGDMILKFTYGIVNYNKQSFDATITVTDLYDASENETFYVRLNSRGFIDYAIEKYDNGHTPDEYWFEYDDEGHLTYAKRSEDNETFNIAYTDGNITSVSKVEGDEPGTNVYTIRYADASVTAPIANTGALMFFDECFGVDLDYIGYAYYAGMLGKATTHLPVRCDESTDTEYETFSWTLGSNSLPTLLNIYMNRPNVAPILDNAISIVW